MRNLLTGVLMLCVAMVCSARSQCDSVDVAKVKASVEVLMRDYPDATLQDVYKSCFQDYFGVAHLLGSREQVYNYICKELEADDYEKGSRYYESCGWQGNYYRVYLKAIKEGYITADMLTDAFMSSAPEVAPQVTDKWVAQWNMIETVVRTHYPDLYNIEDDSKTIREMLMQGKYVMHHSRRFNATYHPHYRIIRSDIFKRDILPHLPKK